MGINYNIMDNSKINNGESLTLEDYKIFFDKISNDVIISASDVDGNIIYVNDKFVEISKYSREELLGQNHRVLKSGYHPQEFYTDMWGTISSGRVWRNEVKNKAKDGSYYWVDSTIAPIPGPDGKPVKYISARFPITAQKNLEEKLKQRMGELEDVKKVTLNALEDLKQEKVNLKERSRILEEKTATLEKMNKLMVGRELKMVELKKEIEDLKKVV